MSSARRSAGQWALLGVAALLVAVVCLIAAQWQWHRHQDRSAEIARIEANYGGPATQLATVLAADGALSPDAEWRDVQLVGRYDVTGTVLLRNRPLGGQIGYHVLVPFRPAAGQVPSGAGEVIVVDRGFLPWANGSPERTEIPLPPRGTVTLDIAVRPAEPASPRPAPGGQVRRIAPDQVIKAAGMSAAPVNAYGRMTHEDPAAGPGLQPLPAPDVNPRSHLSYAVQWCLFAAGAVGGFVLLVRRERQDRTGRTLSIADLLGDHEVSARRKVTAEEEEDALIDAQLGRFGAHCGPHDGAYGPTSP